MKSPMSVIPSAVVDTPSAGTLFSCAIGPAEKNTFDRVGPISADTPSPWMSRS
jgi:hypothetical protein